MFNRFVEWMESLDMMEVLFVLIIPALFAMFLVLLIGAFTRKPDTKYISLSEDEWVCTSSKTEAYTTTILVGKAIIPQSHTRVVCMNYKHK